MSDLDLFRKLASTKAGGKYFSPDQSGLEYLLSARQTKLAHDPVSMFLDGTEHVKEARPWDTATKRMRDAYTAEQAAAQIEPPRALPKGSVAPAPAAPAAPADAMDILGRAPKPDAPVATPTAATAPLDTYGLETAKPRSAPVAAGAPVAHADPGKIDFNSVGAAPSAQAAPSFKQRVTQGVQDATAKVKTVAQEVAAHPTTQNVVGAIKKHGPAVAGGIAAVSAAGAGANHLNKPAPAVKPGMMHGLTAGHALGAAGLLGGGYALYKGLGGGEKQAAIFSSKIASEPGAIQPRYAHTATDPGKHGDAFDKAKHRRESGGKQHAGGPAVDTVGEAVDQSVPKKERLRDRVDKFVGRKKQTAQKMRSAANAAAGDPAVQAAGHIGKSVAKRIALGVALNAVRSAVVSAAKEAPKHVRAPAREVKDRIRPEHMAGLAGLGLLGGGAVHHMATRSDDR